MTSSSSNEVRARLLSRETEYGEAKDVKSMADLFEHNKRWAAKIKSKHPEFFATLALQQSPDYLWIGCADSRVAANEIVGLIPGELFVHRNVANVVAHSDFNCLSVIQYAVDCLQVKHIIVCGHYGCGGVMATLRHQRAGLVDNWLRHVSDVMHKHRACLESCDNEDLKGKRLCELNTIEQAMNVCQTTVVRDAWARGQPLEIHAVIYGMADGHLIDLKLNASCKEDVYVQYEEAISQLPEHK